ncbi:MAG TPA: hypothetical protein VGN86_05710, partial [Pyrinomonadaceae bacterium]|nr:hypothetical protein [Pyrinomonadaceae bacterium]
MPEHVAFYRPSWFQWASRQLGFSLKNVRRLSYQPVSFRQRADETLKNVAFVVYRRAEQAGTLKSLLSRMPVINRIGGWQSSWWTSARDHILVTMTKNG